MRNGMSLSLSFGGFCVYALFLFHISDLSKISLTTSPFLCFCLLGFANSKGYVFGILRDKCRWAFEFTAG